MHSDQVTRRTLLLAAAVSLGSKPVSSDDRVYSVCLALKKLSNLHNRMVRIRGTVHSDLENYCLRDSCNFKLKTSAYVWPCAIWLAGPAMAEVPVDFEPDMKSILQLQDRLKNETHDFSADVAAIIDGRLEARPLRTGFSGNGQIIGMGYGHSGGYPAQLIIRSVILG